MLTGLKTALGTLQARQATLALSSTVTAEQREGFDKAVEIVEGLVKDTANAVRIFRDGDSWCAVYGDFVNFAESSAGFGDTQSGALINLLKKDARS